MSSKKQLVSSAKVSGAIKLHAKATEKYFYELAGDLPWFFPRHSLGKYIEDMIPKCELNPARLNQSGKVDLTKVDTLSDYILALNDKEEWFTNDIATAVIDSSKFWAEKGAKYSFMELVFIQLSTISLVGCTVLYKKDLFLNFQTDIASSVITTGKGIKPRCILKK